MIYNKSYLELRMAMAEQYLIDLPSNVIEISYNESTDEMLILIVILENSIYEKSTKLLENYIHKKIETIYEYVSLSAFENGEDDWLPCGHSRLSWMLFSRKNLSFSGINTPPYKPSQHSRKINFKSLKNASLELKLQADHMVEALQKNIDGDLFAATINLNKRVVIAKLIYDITFSDITDSIDDITVELEAKQIDKVVEILISYNKNDILQKDYIIYRRK